MGSRLLLRVCLGEQRTGKKVRARRRAKSPRQPRRACRRRHSIFFLMLVAEFLCVVKLARVQEDCVVPTVADGGGTVHVWGFIHYHGGRTSHLILERNITVDTYSPLLGTEMLPYARRYSFGRNFLFQHDNSSAPRAHRLQDFLQDAECELLHMATLFACPRHW